MSTELTIPHESSAVSLIREAMKSGATPEYLRELLAVRREWEEMEASKAFNIAVSEFQRRAPIVEKLDVAHNKQYARMDRIWREIRPLLTELGLSVTWQVAELKDGVCRVEGKLRHKDGHGERLAMDIPLPDKVSGQNSAQQAGSASTYARRYALCGALGIVTGDDMDDDGNGAGEATISSERCAEISELFQACQGIDGFNSSAFFGWLGVDEIKKVPASRYEQVKKALNAKLSPAKK